MASSHLACVDVVVVGGATDLLHHQGFTGEETLEDSSYSVLDTFKAIYRSRWTVKFQSNISSIECFTLYVDLINIFLFVNLLINIKEMNQPYI